MPADHGCSKKSWTLPVPVLEWSGSCYSRPHVPRGVGPATHWTVRAPSPAPTDTAENPLALGHPSYRHGLPDRPENSRNRWLLPLSHWNTPAAKFASGSHGDIFQMVQLESVIYMVAVTLPFPILGPQHKCQRPAPKILPDVLQHAKLGPEIEVTESYDFIRQQQWQQQLLILV